MVYQKSWKEKEKKITPSSLRTGEPQRRLPVWVPADITAAQLPRMGGFQGRDWAAPKPIMPRTLRQLYTANAKLQANLTSMPRDSLRQRLTPIVRPRKSYLLSWNRRWLTEYGFQYGMYVRIFTSPDVTNGYEYH